MTNYLLLDLFVICAILAYAAIEFNQYLVLVSRDENEKLSLLVWGKVGIIVIINLLVSYFVYLGVKVKIIKSGEDRYGRTLGFVFVGDLNVNKELLQQVMA